MVSGDGSTMRDLIVCTGHINIVWVIKSRRLRWSGRIARMEEGRSAFKILIGKPTGWRHLGMPRYRRKGNIRMDLKEISDNTR